MRGALAVLRHWMLLAKVLALAEACFAQETTMLAADHAVAAEGEVEFAFELAPVQAGQQVRLALDVRIQWPDLGGSTGAMVAYVNGQGLLGRHLVNKPLLYRMRNDDELAWAEPDGCGYRVLYSPDFSDRVRTDETYDYGVPDTEPYRFVWDITSYVRPGTNSVTIQAVRGMALPLRLRNVVVEVGPPLPPVVAVDQRDATNVARDSARRIYVPRRPSALPTWIEVSAGGNLRLRLGTREFQVCSRTSLPDGGWSDRAEDQADWGVLRRGHEAIVQWQERGYRVERRVRLLNDRLAVADTFTNTSGELLGVIVEHRLKLPEPAIRTYLAGNLVKRLKQRANPAHPTAIATCGAVTLGLVADDDVFRVHSEVFAEDQAVGLADRHLGLAPGARHTLEWSVFLARGGDYWDLVNAIRRSWGVNATLQGPSRWVHPGGVPSDVEAAREWLGNTRVVVLCNPTFGTAEEAAAGITIQHGTALPLCTAWCATAATAVRTLRQACPSVTTYVYTHQNLCTEPGHEGKYQDSLALGLSGERATTVYTPSPSLFLPTASNSYGRALSGVLDLVTDQIDASVYIDEISASNVPAFGDYGEVWDGCTVQIDRATHAVKAKLSSSLLLMQPWREAIVQRLRARGKAILANGPFATRTMLGWGLQCFVESVAGDSAPISAHLSHPLCLASYGSADPRAQTEVVRRALDQGGLSFAAFAVPAPLYPLTPIELRPGVIIGEERILTNRSGLFGWGDDSTAEVIVLDTEGRRIASPGARTVRRGDQALTELTRPPDHLGVLIRTPRRPVASPPTAEHGGRLHTP
mgnify:FL=1